MCRFAQVQIRGSRIPGENGTWSRMRSTIAGRCPPRRDDFARIAWLYPMGSAQAIQRAPHALNEIDVVFIDGAHDFNSVVRDLKVWWPRLRFGGYIAGHDFSMSDPGIMEAIWLFFTVHASQQRVHVFLDSDYVWWVQK